MSESVVYLQKFGTIFQPASIHDFEVAKSIPSGKTIKCRYTIPRNYKFHKLVFDLFRFAYEEWEPDESVAKKSFDSFREDLVISAGYYTTSVSLITNQVKLTAESLSYASMSEDRFRQVYSDIKNVIWHKIFQFKHNYTQAEYDRVINQLWSYD